MIIDAHAHIFPEVRGRIRDGETRSSGYGKMRAGDKTLRVLPPVAVETRFPPEALIEYMDWAGVDRTVLLQGTFYGECNRYASEAIRRYPDRFFGAAFLDPWSPGCRAMFEEAVGELGFRGVKLELSETAGLAGLYPDLRLDDPALDWLWMELEKGDYLLTLDLGAVGSRPYQTDAVGKILERHPNLRVVIAHLCQPGPQVEQDSALWALWQKQVRLAQHPNVYLDTAALPAYLDHEGYPYPSARRYLQAAVDWVGPEHILWGTDVPGLLTVATYKQLVATGWAHTDFLSREDQAKIMGLNAWRVYGRKTAGA
ncbi:MAG: amidohydrolase [candidate division Zixibacteria bacterium]|nr:amidohydrolase [candidate division Zixibacteria bacterium]